MIAGIPEHVRRSVQIMETDCNGAGHLHISVRGERPMCGTCQCHPRPFITNAFHEGTLAWGTDGYGWCSKCEKRLLNKCKEARNVSPVTQGKSVDQTDGQAV